MDKITHELIAKAKHAKNPEEFINIAKANDIEIDKEEAQAYFDQFYKEGETSDEELDSVFGGAFQTPSGETLVSAKHVCENYRCCKCGRELYDVSRVCSYCKFNVRCNTCKYYSYDANKGVAVCRYSKA